MYCTLYVMWFMCSRWHSVNKYYETIISTLNYFARSCVPKVNCNHFISFWTEELGLKNASIDTHALWKLCDEPRSGIVNKIRLENNCRYKCARRRVAFNAEMRFDDEISNLYMKKTLLNFGRNGIINSLKLTIHTTIYCSSGICPGLTIIIL